MSRLRRDIDDLTENFEDPLFARIEAQERAAELEEAKHRAAERGKQLAEQDRLIAQRRIDGLREANERARLNEYARYGLEPQRCSLSLLLGLGWRIEQDEDGKYILVKGPNAP